MSSFSDSKIVTARKQRPCSVGGNRVGSPTLHMILKGERYLRYRLGQRNDIRVCLTCATTKPQSWDCAALRQHMGTA